MIGVNANVGSRLKRGLGDLARRQPGAAGLHQKAEDGQPGRLGEGGEGVEGGIGFHIS